MPWATWMSKEADSTVVEDIRNSTKSSNYPETKILTISHYEHNKTDKGYVSAEKSSVGINTVSTIDVGILGTLDLGEESAKTRHEVGTMAILSLGVVVRTIVSISLGSLIRRPVPEVPSLMDKKER